MEEEYVMYGIAWAAGTNQGEGEGGGQHGGTCNPQLTWFSFALPPTSKKLAGDPPFSNFPKAASSLAFHYQFTTLPQLRLRDNSVIATNHRIQMT